MLLALEDSVMETRISWRINEEVKVEFSSGRFCIQEVSLMLVAHVCQKDCIVLYFGCTVFKCLFDTDMCKELILCVRFLNN
jgi:hypothetical protein